MSHFFVAIEDVFGVGKRKHGTSFRKDIAA